MSDDPDTTPPDDGDGDEKHIDPEPIDIDGEDIAAVLPHRDHPDQDPPGAADAPVPG